jgi:hypothetical protein
MQGQPAYRCCWKMKRIDPEVYKILNLQNTTGIEALKQRILAISYQERMYWSFLQRDLNLISKRIQRNFIPI